MEDQKPEKLKLKLKFSKPLDDLQQPKLIVHLKQEQAQEYDYQDGVYDEDDDDFKEGEIRDQEQEQEREQEVEKDQGKVCPHCGKEFKNGKALGGHLRVHAVNPSRAHLKAKEDGSNPNPGAAEVCQICLKTFPSQKSLFGHMRSYPERTYRGMNPPQSGSNPPLVVDLDANSDDHSSGQVVVVDPSAEKGLEGLIGWKVKGPRGGLLDSLSVEPSEVSSSSLSNGHLVEVAASKLMMIASGDDEEHEVKSRFTTVKKNDDKGFLKRKIISRIDEYDDDELYYLQDILGIPYNSPTSTSRRDNNNNNNSNNNPILLHRCGTATSAVTATTPTPVSSTTFDHPNKVLASSQRVIKSSEEIISPLPSKKRKIIKDLESLDVVANHDYNGDNDNDDHDDDLPKREFKCSTCGRSFDTHQALGGHRSSHNKERATLQLKNPNPARNGNGSGSTHLGTGSKDGANAGNGDNGEMVGEVIHKCKICNQGFPSGQALGGHQRCHYVVRSNESSPGQTSSQTGRQGIIHGLDLNVSMQDEDVDVESNYNS